MFGRYVLVLEIGMAVLIAQLEQLGAGKRAHRMTLAEIGINPDLHQLSLQLRYRQLAISGLYEVSI
jgi:hypothetical protein